ncbi:LOW QUALITY PROTEIN: hypothetical protein V1477_019479, partial [Vespula maculifrons]
MLDWVAFRLRLGIGGRSFSTRIRSARVITNRDTNVTRGSKGEDGHTNGSTKLRNIQKFEIDLKSLRIVNVLRFMVLLNRFFAVNQLEQRYMIQFVDEENDVLFLMKPIFKERNEI